MNFSTELIKIWIVVSIKDTRYAALESTQMKPLFKKNSLTSIITLCLKNAILLGS